MKTPEDNWAQQARSTLEECFDQMRFARATELARSRRFLEAEALLSPDGRLPDNTSELDLLARILAQQNHFREAKRCWEAALQITPRNEAYQNGIKRLEQVEKFTKLRRKVALIGGAALLVATLVVWAVKLLPSRSHGTPKQKIQPAQPTAPVPPQPNPKTPPAQAPPQPSQPKPTQPKPAQPSPTPQKR